MAKDKTQYIPFLVTVLLVIYTIVEIKTRTGIHEFNGLEFEYVVPSSIWVSAMILGALFILMLLKIRFWKHLFSLFLLAGALGFIVFRTRFTGFNFGFIKIDFISLLMLFFQLAINREPQAELFKLLGLSLEEPNSTTPINENEVDEFLQRFDSKSNSELELIASSQKHAPAAVEAAKRLLTKRETS